MENIYPADLTPKKAIEIQNNLRSKVILKDDFGEIKTIAGVDLQIGHGWTAGRCGIVVLTFPELEIIETIIHTSPIDFPYIPGLLAFREVPIFLETYSQLQNQPDLFFFDGHGYAHPRRFGLACHAGVLLDKPAIGCAKSKLVGFYEEPGIEAGSVSPLLSGEEIIGDVIRTKTGTKPVFVSPGHKVSFSTATTLALQCVRGYRIPEPTRLAHNLVSGKN